jgi:hypothetical protein
VPGAAPVLPNVGLVASPGKTFMSLPVGVPTEPEVLGGNWPFMAGLALGVYCDGAGAIVVVLGGREFICAMAPIELTVSSNPAADSEKSLIMRTRLITGLDLPVKPVRPPGVPTHPWRSRPRSALEWSSKHKKWGVETCTGRALPAILHAIRTRMEELRRERHQRRLIGGDEIVVSPVSPIKRGPVPTDKPLSPVIRRLLSRSARWMA